MTLNTLIESVSAVNKMEVVWPSAGNVQAGQQTALWCYPSDWAVLSNKEKVRLDGLGRNRKDE